MFCLYCFKYFIIEAMHCAQAQLEKYFFYSQPMFCFNLLLLYISLFGIG